MPNAPPRSRPTPGLEGPLPASAGRVDRLKQATERLLHHPRVELLIIGLILVAVAAVLAEEATQGQPSQWVFTLASDITAGLFAIELSLRWWIAPRKRDFFARYWLDILAVLPLFRPLRLLRVLMLLRLFRAGSLLQRRTRLLRGMLGQTMSEIAVLSTASAAMVLGAAVLLHSVQGAVVYDQTSLDPTSLESTAWFALYTLVGGEPIGGVPVSPTGRWATIGLMLGGLTVFGVFIGAVSATMTAALSQRGNLDMHYMGDLSGHIVVCGWNTAGPTMLRELMGGGPRGRAIVIVCEEDEEPPELAPLRADNDRLFFLKSDYTRVEVLETLSVKRASGVIILSDKHGNRSYPDRDARTVLTALTIERMAPGIFVCAELINSQHEDLLRMAGVEAVVIRDWYAGALMGSIGRSRGVSAVISDLLTPSAGNALHSVDLPRRLAGKTVLAVQQELKAEHEAVLVSLDRPGQPSRVNPPSDEILRAEDRLIVIAKAAVKL